MALERKGVPTATFLTDAFSEYARGLANLQGMAALPTIVIAHPVAARPAEELRARVHAVYPALRAALTQTE